MACCFLFAGARSAVPPPDLPAAIFTDPVVDTAHPQNLDLAQVLRRAGWTVITFHYTGSWGSGGQFTLRGGIDDALALLAYLRVPTHAKSWDVDPERILLLGHSYGGYVAARTAVESPGVIGVVMLAPWDISFDSRKWSALPLAGRNQAAATTFDDVDGRLAGATDLSLLEEMMRYGSTLDLAKLAAPLASRSVLLITASRDDDDDKAADFITGMQCSGATHFTTQLMDTDHSFNSHRVALQASILRWLAVLPGAPHQ